MEADPDRVARWRERLGAYAGLTVGLTWQGNLNNPGGAARAVPLARLKPLFEVPGVRFVSLQKGSGSEQARSLPASVPLIDFTAEMDEGSGAFVDTAAVIRNLDLVIAIDTAVAHLAGAMGVPTWLALAIMPHWTWLLGRSDSPWYPTMRLFRQRKPGDWQGVFEDMQSALGERVRDLSQPRRITRKRGKRK